MLGGPEVLERLGGMSRERNLKVASRLDGMVRWLGRRTASGGANLPSGCWIFFCAGDLPDTP